MANEDEVVGTDEDTEEELSDEESAEEPQKPSQDKPKRTPEEQLKYLEGRTQRLRKKLGLTEPKPTPKNDDKQKTGELDETQELFLTVKGIEATDEVDLVKDWIKNTGKGVKEIVGNKRFQAELSDLRADKEVKDATPSSTKRSGAATTDPVEVALAKFERTGELPADFTLRSAVVNAKMERDNTNKPPWR